MIITGKELSRSSEIEVVYGGDIRKSIRCIGFNGILICKVYKIKVENRKTRRNVLILESKKGREISRVVLEINQGLEIDRQFGEYKVVECA